MKFDIFVCETIFFVRFQLWGWRFPFERLLRTFRKHFYDCSGNFRSLQASNEIKYEGGELGVLHKRKKNRLRNRWSFCSLKLCMASRHWHYLITRKSEKVSITLLPTAKNPNVVWVNKLHVVSIILLRRRKKNMLLFADVKQS